MLGTHFIETNLGEAEVSIAYTDIGPEENMSMLYMHGWGCSRYDFAGAAEETNLVRRRKVAFSQPGCDGTPYPEAALDASDLVTLTHELVMAANIGGAAVIGHSFGSVVALRYALKYPAVVNALISVEGNFVPDDCFMTRDVAEGREDRDSLAARFSRSDSAGFLQYAAQLRRTDPRAYVDYAQSAVAHSDRDDMLSAFIELSEIIPTLFVYGDQNVGSIGYLSDLRASDVQVAEIPNSGHFPFADNPAAYYGVIGAFMSEIDSP